MYEWMREGAGRVRESWRIPFEKDETGMILFKERKS
jgi:hypothetical protein